MERSVGTGAYWFRADPADAPSLLTRPGAGPAEMGSGRPMSAGWIQVDADVVAPSEAPRSWLDAALACQRAD